MPVGKAVSHKPSNPLLPWVLRWLRCTALPAKEYALIQYLDVELASWPFEIDHQEPSLRLFQKHFLVMNSLYRLQVDFAADGLQLVIDPLGITLQPLAQNGHGDQGGEATHRRSLSQDARRDEALANYYLDWSHFQAATTESVESLLKQFWRRFANVDSLANARRVLGVDAATSYADLQLTYRRLARRHHPDGGGDAATFIEIREAYETLRQALGNT